METAATPLLPVHSKTFYSDIDVAQNATQDQILTATVHSFYHACGFDPSLETSDSSTNPEVVVNDYQIASKVADILAAFSTLYDANSRAAYDKFGDNMFASLSVDSHASSKHPTVVNYTARWKQYVYAVLATILLITTAVCIYHYYISPLDYFPLHIPAYSYLAMPISFSITALIFMTKYVYFAWTGNILWSSNLYPINGIDSASERLVRLYGTDLLIRYLPEFVAFNAVGLGVISTLTYCLGLCEKIYTSHFFWLLIPGPLLGTISTLIPVVRNSGFNAPHLNLFFNELASRVSSDLPSLDWESRVKLFGHINDAVYRARTISIWPTALCVSTLAGMTYCDAIGFEGTGPMITLFSTWVAVVVTRYAVMFASKGLWSYSPDTINHLP
ncbi:hypothetical protein GQ42DRAFT_160505 [Ramicandelaber brevisporus]|nr:hypothetical protein GQ42DRAFT_160505 [Ramicandelaber brevisporus]